MDSFVKAHSGHFLQLTDRDHALAEASDPVYKKKEKKNAVYKEETEKVEKLRKQRKLHYLVTSTSLYGYLTKVTNSCRGRQK